MIPVIPGVNDTEEEMNGLAGIIQKSVNIEAVNLIPFHQLSGSKYESLGLDYRAAGIKPPTQEGLDKISAVFAGYGIKVNRISQ